MRKVLMIASGTLILAWPANAAFDRWSAETETDPFSGGKKIIVDYAMSARSAVLLFCDTTESGIEIRVVPGYVYEPRMADFRPVMEFAIDGARLSINVPAARVAMVGDSLTAISLRLSPEAARAIVSAFAKAGKQIAIRDGMSDRPHFLRATGSTKAGQAIADCVEKQSGGASEAVVESETSDMPIFKFGDMKSGNDYFVTAPTEIDARALFKAKVPGGSAISPVVSPVRSVPFGYTLIRP